MKSSVELSPRPVRARAIAAAVVALTALIPGVWVYVAFALALSAIGGLLAERAHP